MHKTPGQHVRFWNFSLTFQYSAVNGVDATGTAVAVTPAFHALGATLGPAAAAALIRGDDLSAVNYLAAASVILSLTLFVLAYRVAARRPVGAWASGA